MVDEKLLDKLTELQGVYKKISKVCVSVYFKQEGLLCGTADWIRKKYSFVYSNVNFWL